MGNSIRVKSASEYIIEVNDQGETISFDMQDTGLTSKMMRSFDKIDAISKEYTEKAAEIDAREDEPYSTVEVEELNEETKKLEKKTKVLVTKNQYDGSKLIDDFYSEARSAMDVFLGTGACQKIFGDKNYFSMFNDLMEQLEPHFKKMGINAEKLKKSAALKHAPNRAARRALK